MKKIIFILIIALALVIFLNVKHTEEPIVDTSSIQKDTPTTEIQPAEETEVSYSFEYTNIHFSHSPTEAINVSIDYPQFKDEKLNELNKKIETLAKSKFKESIENPEISQDILLKESLAIKLANSSIVSILCKGEYANSISEHTNIISKVYNIHPLSLDEYETTDLINVSDEFINLFKDKILKNENHANYLINYTLEDYKALILASNLYMTNKELVMIVSLSQEAENFIEVTFSKNEIKDFLISTL